LLSIRYRAEISARWPAADTRQFSPAPRKLLTGFEIRVRMRSPASGTLIAFAELPFDAMSRCSALTHA
jgi:hypothetical protein